MPDALPDLLAALDRAVKGRQDNTVPALAAAIRAHPEADVLARLICEVAELRISGFRDAASSARLPGLYEELGALGERETRTVVAVMLGVLASRRSRPLDVARWALDALDLGSTDPTNKALAARLLASAHSRLGRPRARREALEQASVWQAEGDDLGEQAMVAVELAQARVVLREPVDFEELEAQVARCPALMPRAAIEDIKATAASIRQDLPSFLAARHAFVARSEALGADNPMHLQARVALGRVLVALRDTASAEPLLAPLPAPHPRLEVERSLGAAHLALRLGDLERAAGELQQAPPAVGLDRASRVAVEAALAVRQGRDGDAGVALAELSRSAGRSEAPFAEAIEMLALWSDLPERAVVPRARLLAAVSDRIVCPPVDADLRAARRDGAPVPVGPWDLERRIASGGMGEVWRGVHVGTGTPAALKLLKRHGRKASAMEALEREARMIAALRHPAIVELYESGPVPRSAAVASGGALEEGTPWVAMELVPGGTLAPLCGELDWPAMRGLLLNLLDALAFAHARDVLHLDIKPHNVLIQRNGLDLTAKLTDFGMAWLREADRSLDGHVAGTPTAMAPEQWHGRWRTFGAETDLYALGCLAWQLVTGEFVHGFGTPVELRAAHCHKPLPPFVPRRPVPADLHRWLEGLLQKAPEDRPRSAAEAALGLHALAGPLVDVLELAPVRPLRSVDTTLCLSQVLAREPAPAGVPAALPSAPPTVPLTLSARPADTGGARLIGRGPVKQALWAAFLEGSGPSGPVRVALDGPRGVGCTALVDWLVVQAASVGALALRIRRTDQDARDVLRRWLHLTPDDPEKTVRRHLQRFAGSRAAPDVLARCAELLLHGTDVDALVLLVEDLARVGPVVLDLGDLDDRQAPAASAMLGVDAPLTVVGVGAQDGFRRVPVDPLEPDVLARIVQDAYGIRPPDALSLAHGAGGRVADVLHTARALKDRGLLLPMPDGAAVPDPRLLADVVGGAAGPLAPEDLPQLQVAAVLGEAFSAEDFEALCEEVEARRPGLWALASRGVLEAPTRGGTIWRFVDPSTRRQALRSMGPGGERELNARAAERVRDPRRRLRHLLAAGRREQALARAQEAAAMESTHPGGRGTALEGLRDVLDQLHPTGTASPWASYWLALAERSRLAGDHSTARAHAARVAETDATPAQSARAALLIASGEGPDRALGRLDALPDPEDPVVQREIDWARALLQGDTDVLERCIDAWELADPPRAERARATIALRAGDLRRAAASFVGAAAREPDGARAHRDRLDAVGCLRRAGDLPAASRLLERVREGEGDVPTPASVFEGALLAWAEGRWSDARAAFDALRSQPVPTGVSRAISLLLAAAEESDDAVVLRRLHELGTAEDPGERPWLLELAAWTAIRAGRPERAALFEAGPSDGPGPGC